MAFQTRSEGMLKTAKQYMAAWQPDTACGPRDNLVSLLKQVSAPSGILFKADGVVHLEDRTKNVEELADHIQERQRAYKHVAHDMFASAADEETNSVFMGVRFLMQSVGPVAGQEPSGWPSQGVLIERLEMDENNQITQALVCRQLTHEETEALTVNPSAMKAPEPDEALLHAPEEKLTPEEVNSMRSAAQKWVHCWDTGANLEDLDKVLAPDVEQLQAYGLASRSVPFSGIQGASKAIQGALSKVENVNTLLGSAVCTDRRAGFVHWQTGMLHAGQRSPQAMQGLDFLRFSPDNRIAKIWSFTMKPYKNVKGDAPRKEGVD